MISYTICVVACVASFNIGAVFLAAWVAIKRGDEAVCSDDLAYAFESVARTCDEFCERLDKIEALETPHASHTVKKMAAIARGE